MWLLTLAASSAAYAKTALGPLQESIRIALSLTDNQMAMLQGPALALPMVIVAIPLGLLIDRYSRARLLLGLCTLNLLCSGLTAAAPSFAVLFAVRCVIGLTAFTITPVVLSVLADLYAPAQRGRATMIMTVGQYGGAAAAFALGGSLLATRGIAAEAWRSAMLWLTLPLVAILLLTAVVREPTRTDIVVAPSSIRISCTEFWQLRAFIVPVLLGVALTEMGLGASLVWSAPTLARDFGLAPQRVGVTMAGVLLVSGVLGTIVGGLIADLCQRQRGPARTMVVLASLALIGAPGGLFAVMPGVVSAGALLILFVASTSATGVMGGTLLTVVVPNELRGLCLALLFAAGAIVGVGVAPLTVSLLSGVLGGPTTIGTALTIVCVAASLVSAAMITIGIRPLTRMAPTAALN